ncbi:MAG TPA: trehalose-phosphatase [Terriglobia bacterium]|nr:trehalose-phosphatase [Terriglobia bacterium]
MFDCWNHVAARLRRAERLLLLLDFDGTLVGFRRNPEDVRLEESVRSLLARLARRNDVSLGFISGRRRADLLHRVNVPGAKYWGLHGWEKHPSRRLNGSSRRAILSLREALGSAISPLSGVWLDDKHATLALHYRGAPSDAAREARAITRKVLAARAPQFRILRGKKIWELLPSEIEGKGAVVAHLAHDAPAGTLAVYIGDDTTDEAAFAALTQGLTIRVGRPKRTHARFRLRNPGEVRQFLERLAAETRRQGRVPRNS